jgi:hypothetical protein
VELNDILIDRKENLFLFVGSPQENNVRNKLKRDCNLSETDHINKRNESA